MASLISSLTKPDIAVESPGTNVASHRERNKDSPRDHNQIRDRAREQNSTPERSSKEPLLGNACFACIVWLRVSVVYIVFGSVAMLQHLVPDRIPSRMLRKKLFFWARTSMDETSLGQTTRCVQTPVPHDSSER